MKRAYAGGVVLIVLAGCGKGDGAKPKTSDEPTVAANAAPAPALTPTPTPAPAPAAPPLDREAVVRDAPPPPAPEEADADPDEKDKNAKPPQVKRAGVLDSTALTKGGAFAEIIANDTSGFPDDAIIQGGLTGDAEAEKAGGFGHGRAGFGPGGSGRASAVPQARIGQPACTGDLDKAIIRRYIKRNITKITYCYEKQLLANAKLEGTVNTQFVISDKGTVIDARANGVDAEVASCIATVIKIIEFPKPKGGGKVQCTYPFNFTPAGG